MEKEKKIPQMEDLERVLLHPYSYIERWTWRIKGTHTWHHPTEPAIQYKDGDWIWFWMGREHRWDGPARFVAGGYEYWIHGEPLDRDQWLRHPQRLEWLKTKLGSL